MTHYVFEGYDLTVLYVGAVRPALPDADLAPILEYKGATGFDDIIDTFPFPASDVGKSLYVRTQSYTFAPGEPLGELRKRQTLYYPDGLRLVLKSGRVRGYRKEKAARFLAFLEETVFPSLETPAPEAAPQKPPKAEAKAEVPPPQEKTPPPPAEEPLGAAVVGELVGDGPDARRPVRVGSWELAAWVGRGEKDEPRIYDLDLAAKLGYAQPRQIRELIKRRLSDPGFGEVCRTVRQTSDSGGRPGEEFHLTFDQATEIAAVSETENGKAILRMMIRVFKLARQGLLPQQRPAPQLKAELTAEELALKGVQLLMEVRGHVPAEQINSSLARAGDLLVSLAAGRRRAATPEPEAADLDACVRSATAIGHYCRIPKQRAARIARSVIRKNLRLDHDPGIWEQIRGACVWVDSQPDERGQSYPKCLYSRRVEQWVAAYCDENGLGRWGNGQKTLFEDGEEEQAAGNGLDE